MAAGVRHDHVARMEAHEGFPFQKGGHMRGRNGGIRKRCDCVRKNWPKCPHQWHLNFKHGQTHYRFSLDKEVGRRIEGKGEAEAEAERLRTEIREGRFRRTA